MAIRASFLSNVTAALSSPSGAPGGRRRKKQKAPHAGPKSKHPMFLWRATAGLMSLRHATFAAAADFLFRAPRAFGFGAEGGAD